MGETAQDKVPTTAEDDFTAITMGVVDEEEYDTKIRVQSLALAVENSWPGQDLDEVMSRAIRFYNFLTRQVN